MSKFQNLEMTSPTQFTTSEHYKSSPPPTSNDIKNAVPNRFDLSLCPSVVASLLCDVSFTALIETLPSPVNTRLDEASCESLHRWMETRLG